MINNRYILKNRLFSSETSGELYQARDTRADRGSRFVDVLLHFLPAAAFNYPAFRQTYTALKQAEHARPGINVLEILEGGWTGDKAFFVLETPNSWSYSALQPVPDQPLTSVHRRAGVKLATLQKTGHITHSLETFFFLVDSEGSLCLLSTAFAPAIQALQTNPDYLLAPVHHETPPRIKPNKFPLLMGLSGAAIAGALVVYNSWQSGTPFVESTPQPATTLSQAEIIDTPETTQPVALIEATTDEEPTVLVTEAAEIKEPKLTEQTPTPKPAGIMPIEPVNTANKHIRWNGMDEERLLQRAEKSQQQGRIQAALYFARILKRQGSQHIRLTKLATLIANDYQYSADTLLDSGDADEAKILLRQADRLINTFNLLELKAQQAKLHNKLAE